MQIPPADDPSRMVPSQTVAQTQSVAHGHSIADARPGAWKDFVEGVMACVPTVLGYLSIGFSAGAMAKVSGLSVAEIALMSLIIYAGASQFIVASMLQAQATTLSIVLAVFFINLRHLLLSAYLARHFGHLGTAKTIVIGSQLTDESFGVAALRATRDDRLPFGWMFGLNLTAYLNWLLGTVVGALSASLIPQAYLHSLQFALIAMFVGLIAMQVHASRARAMQITAGVLAVGCVPLMNLVVGKSFSVVASALLASTLALGLSRWTSARAS